MLQYGALILAGGLQTLTLAPFGFWFLGPASLILLLLSTKLLTPEKLTGKKAFLFGWTFGIGLFGAGASWVYVSINTYGNAPPVLASALTIVFVLGLSLFTALNFWLYNKFKFTDTQTTLNRSVILNALLFTSVWVLGDAFRTVFLTGFPWLFLGYGHLESPLAGWIPIIGIYGITAIVVLSGAVLAALIQTWLAQAAQYPNLKPEKPISSFKSVTSISAISVVSILWIGGFALDQIAWSKPGLDPEGKELTQSVALLQTNIPQELKWKASQRWKTMKLLKKMSEEQWDKDLIVWPETAVPQLHDLAKRYINKMDERASNHDTSIISGIPYREIDPETKRQILHNSIMSIGDGTGIYHKQKLVPFGEYVPLQEILRGLIAFFDLPMSDFRTGSVDQENLRAGAFVTSPFICYEVVYPDFVAARAQDVDYLITISNDSWFGASIGPLQHLEMAQFRAAENARYMVRGTNNGISAIIDEKGKIVDQSEQFVRTTLESEFKIMIGQTPFSRFGSWPLLILCGLFTLFAFYQGRTTKHTN